MADYNLITDDYTKNAVHRILEEYRILTVARRIKICKEEGLYDRLIEGQKWDDIDAADKLFELIKQEQLIVLRDWFLRLVDDEKEQTVELKEFLQKQNML